MALGWLCSIDAHGLLVRPEFLARLQRGQTAALRSLAQANLTDLYRRKYSTLKTEHLQQGLFWQDEAPVRIPFVRAVRGSPPAWVPVKVIYRGDSDSSEAKQILRWLESSIDPTLREPTWRQSIKRVSKKGEPEVIVGGPTPVPMFPGYSAKYKCEKVEVAILKPNPKFELVVINKYDRAALMHLLAALDTESNVETWIAARMSRSGATQPQELHDLYSAWCKQTGEAPTGIKSFAQALVAANVVKLKRGKDGERYQLEPRPSARSQ